MPMPQASAWTARWPNEAPDDKALSAPPQNRAQAPSAALRRRAGVLLVAIVALVVGQILTLVIPRKLLWPLDPIAVYVAFPDDDPPTASARAICAQTDQGTVPVGALPHVDYKVIRIFSHWLRRTPQGTARRQIWRHLYDYVTQRAAGSAGARVVGFEQRREVWDLRAGQLITTEPLDTMRVDGQ